MFSWLHVGAIWPPKWTQDAPRGHLGAILERFWCNFDGILVPFWWQFWWHFGAIYIYIYIYIYISPWAWTRWANHLEHYHLEQNTLSQCVISFILLNIIILYTMFPTRFPKISTKRSSLYLLGQRLVFQTITSCWTTWVQNSLVNPQRGGGWWAQPVDKKIII